MAAFFGASLGIAMRYRLLAVGTPHQGALAHSTFELYSQTRIFQNFQEAHHALGDFDFGHFTTIALNGNELIKHP